ncbi:MAG: ice-binding family protein [Candidatus Dormiibacterota bacterium]
MTSHLGILKASRRAVFLACVLGVTIGALPTVAMAAVTQPRLLSAGNFTVMAASAITNTGATTITGNLAISPNKASSVTGFPPGVVTGAKDEDNAVAIKAQTDLVTTYNDAAHATPFKNMSGVNLGGKTLTPGVYHFSSSAQLTGTLTLNGEGRSGSLFIFQIGSTLTTATRSRVALIGRANSCNVFWQVTSSATLGTATSFQGNLIALTSITMVTGATIGVGGGLNGGRALARNGALTLDSNIIRPPTGTCPTTASTSTSTSTTPSTPTAGAAPNALAPWLLASGALLVMAAIVRRRPSR